MESISGHLCIRLGVGGLQLLLQRLVGVRGRPWLWEVTDPPGTRRRRQDTQELTIFGSILSDVLVNAGRLENREESVDAAATAAAATASSAVVAVGLAPMACEV